MDYKELSEEEKDLAKKVLADFAVNGLFNDAHHHQQVINALIDYKRKVGLSKD